MDNAKYHTLTHMQSATMLKTLYRDAGEYERKYVSETEPADDLSGKTQVMIGDAVHQVLLDKKDIEDVACIYPEDCFKSNGTLNPKPAKEYRLEMAADNKMVLKDSDFKRVVGACNAAMKDDLGTLLNLDGAEFEEPLFWTDASTGLACKCRPDFMYAGEHSVGCYDLKVSADVAPRNWERIAKNLLYWLQDAHYSSGIAQKYQKPVTFEFWVIESVVPHRIVQYQFDPISRERAGEAYGKLLADLKDRKENNYWREDWEEESQMLTLNPWDIKNSEDELEGFDVKAIQTQG